MLVFFGQHLKAIKRLMEIKQFPTSKLSLNNGKIFIHSSTKAQWLTIYFFCLPKFGLLFLIIFAKYKAGVK